MILDKEEEGGYRQLNDKTYYFKLKKPVYLDTIPIVEKVINNLYQKKHKKYLLSQGQGSSITRSPH